MQFTGTDSYIAEKDLMIALLKNDQDLHLFERLVFMARREMR